VARTGVLLLGFGGPDSLDAVAPFMCNLMGREPSEELVARVCERYLTIGGASPLTGIANDIADALELRLSELERPAPVRVGMRYWEPYIRDALAELVAEGCDRIVTVSLSPFESKVASGAYREAIAEATTDLGHIEIVEAPLVSDLDEYVDFFAGATAVGITDVEPSDGAIVVFTAHSLPESDMVDGDPYVAGLRRMAESVAEKLGMSVGHEGAGEPLLPGFAAYGSAAAPRAWFLVYQSKGAKPGAWLGPELEEIIDAAAASKVEALVVCPIGFMTDHMETLYDLDVIAAERAIDADLGFVRVDVPNSDARVVDGIAKSVARLL
jgi:ferrochelatase